MVFVTLTTPRQLLGSELVWRSQPVRPIPLATKAVFLLQCQQILSCHLFPWLTLHIGQDNAVDVFPLAFLNVFFGTGGEPSLNLANVNEFPSTQERSSSNSRYQDVQPHRQCHIPWDRTSELLFPCFRHNDLPIQRQDHHPQLRGCYGRCRIFISFPSYEFRTDHMELIPWRFFIYSTIWKCRFGRVCCDCAPPEPQFSYFTSVDLDIEGGGSAYYDSFVNEIRSLAAGASKK